VIATSNALDRQRARISNNANHVPRTANEDPSPIPVDPPPLLTVFVLTLSALDPVAGDHPPNC